MRILCESGSSPLQNKTVELLITVLRNLTSSSLHTIVQGEMTDLNCAKNASIFVNFRENFPIWIENSVVFLFNFHRAGGVPEYHNSLRNNDFLT